MVGEVVGSCIQQLRNQQRDEAGDGELLGRFLAGEGERAFHALVDRHGPMILALCRRLLPDLHLAEDAFQTTFLTLARKADTIRKGDSVGSWLYGVAYRTATRARAHVRRRQVRERPLDDPPAPAVVERVEADELRRLLDEELHRLPLKYRSPLVLCYLEGQTNEKAAVELRCPPGTVKTRLARGRELLRDRLARRGWAGSGLPVLAGLGDPAVPAHLVGSTVGSAVAALLDRPAFGTLPAVIQGALSMIQANPLRSLMSVALTVGLMVGLASWLAHGSGAAEPTKPPAPPPGAETAKEAPLPAELALVPADTADLTTIRVAHLWKSKLGQTIQDALSEMPWKVVPEPVREFDRLLTAAGLRMEQIDRLTRMDSLGITVVTVVEPYDRGLVRKAFLPKGQATDAAGNLSIDAHPSDTAFGGLYFLNDRTFAVGKASSVSDLRDRHRPVDPTGPLARLLQSATKASLATAIDPSKMPGFFQGKEPLDKALLLGWVAELGEKAQVEMRCDYAEEQDATAALPKAQAFLDQFREGTEGTLLGLKDQAIGKTAFYRSLTQAVKKAAIRQEGRALRATLQVEGFDRELADVLAGSVQSMGEAAQRTHRANNLHQIGIAMHTYHDDHGHFPTTIHDKDGKPLLSWRVALLPYIEHGDLKFKLDEPWDSDHNKELLEKMPKLYAPVGTTTKEPYRTFLRGFAGAGGIVGGPKGVALEAIVSGTSNTLLVVEAGEAVPWTKPDDLELKADQPLPRFGYGDGEQFLALFADAHVQALPRKIDAKLLRCAADRNNKEPIELPLP